MLIASKRFAIAAFMAVLIEGTIAWAVFDAYYPVRPQLLCVAKLSPGTTMAFFGFANEAEETKFEPAGDRNGFSPGPVDRGQPIAFPPGSSGGFPKGAFSVPFSGPVLTWRLGTREVEATPESPACPEPQQLKELPAAAFVMPEVVVPPPEPPPEPPPPEPPKEEPKEAEPPPPDETPPAPKEQVRPQRGQPKQQAPPRAEPITKVEPPPLVLEGLTGLEGGMAVQSGDRTVLGDAGIAATPENTKVQTGPGRSDGVEGGTGTGPARAPKRTPPKVTKRVAGVYPEDAPRLGRVVVVGLSLLVGTDGTVKQVKVVRKAGAAFDREAELVGRKLRFEPATVDGEPVEQWIPWTVEFTPDDW